MPAATKRVAGTVTSLVATRDGNTIKAEWKNPGPMFDENRPDHATWLDANINFDSTSVNKTSGQVWDPDNAPSGAKTLNNTDYDNYWIKGLGTKTSFEKPFDRSRYYPVGTDKLKFVDVYVHGGNDSGVGGWDPDNRQASGRGPDAYTLIKFDAPQKPAVKVTGWTDAENYHFGYEVKANPKDVDEGKTTLERYDTRIRIMRQDNLPNSGYKSKKTEINWFSVTEDEFDGSYPGDSNIQSLADGQWVEWTVEAFSRGLNGDSYHDTQVMLASRPQRGVIDSISVSSLDIVTGIITVNVYIGSDEHRWTTKAKLQRAKNVNPDWDADRVALSASWEDVSGMVQISDEWKAAYWTMGFTDSVRMALPDVNKRTWYRVVTENDLYYDDNAYISTPVEASKLFRDLSVSGSEVFIEDVKVSDDATSLKLRIGWPNDEASGTEVSWSTHVDAWESSELPTVANVTWKDATTQGTHANSASFTIYGVEPGNAVYIRARRYLEEEEKIVAYGPYSTASQELYPIIPAVPPREVQLIAPNYVPRGSDIPLTWTFKADTPQTAWAVYLIDGGERVAVASGDDAYGSCTIQNSMVPDDSAKLVVSLTTGSEWADSQEAEVFFADAPVISVALPSTETDDNIPIILKQPVSLYCSSDTGDDALRVRVVSNGITVQNPDSEVKQLAGDAIFDAYVYPEWHGSDGGFTTVVTLPQVEMYDVGVYTFEVTGVNQTTGLVSETQTISGRVRWYHQAHQPGDASTVTAYQDDRVCVITPAAPDNAASSDAFDLYRVTPDGACLVADNLPFGSSVSDRYAPFGRGPLLYRICTRTADGDISWRDVDYEMKCVKLRFDWGEQHLELPYNLVRNESWAKDFERRKHLDGNIGGGWNPAVDHDGSISTDLVRFESSEEQALVRSLANHAGPVFVRLPNGLASQANVDVNGLEESYQSGAMAASFTASFVSLTDEFKVAISEVSYSGTSSGETYEKQVIGYWGETQPTRNDTFTLPETPTSIRVKLSTSYDRYTNEFTVPATFSGTTVTLGTFSSELQAYLQEAAGEGTLYLVRCEYA